MNNLLILWSIQVIHWASFFLISGGWVFDFIDKFDECVFDKAFGIRSIKIGIHLRTMPFPALSVAFFLIKHIRQYCRLYAWEPHRFDVNTKSTQRITPMHGYEHNVGKYAHASTIHVIHSYRCAWTLREAAEGKIKLSRPVKSANWDE